MHWMYLFHSVSRFSRISSQSQARDGPPKGTNAMHWGHHIIQSPLPSASTYLWTLAMGPWGRGAVGPWGHGAMPPCHRSCTDVLRLYGGCTWYTAWRKIIEAIDIGIWDGGPTFQTGADLTAGEHQAGALLKDPTQHVGWCLLLPWRLFTLVFAQSVDARKVHPFISWTGCVHKISNRVRISDKWPVPNVAQLHLSTARGSRSWSWLVSSGLCLGYVQRYPLGAHAD